MQRVHWDPEFARRSGNPTTFDYGRMRETWLIHLCTDWMGDDAWLWKLDCEFRRFNYVGDTQWLRGTVDAEVPRRRRPAGGRPRRSRPRTSGARSRRPGHATVLLPEPRARPGAPARPARRRHRPAGRARRDRGRVRAASERLTPTPVDGLARRARRRRAARSRSTGPTSATRSTTTMVAGADRRDRRRRPRRGGARRSCSTGDGRPLLRRRRHRRPATRRPTAQRPRVGRIQRRLPSQAHRLDPAAAARCRCRSSCAVRGWAAGIGLHLALAADFTVAADDARFWEPFGAARASRPTAAARGCCRAGSAWRGPASCCCSAARLDGAEAAEWGLVHRAVPAAERRRRRPRRWPRSSRPGPTVALGLTKWLLHAGQPAAARRTTSPNEAFALELSSRSEDFREGLAAFGEKRDPDFEGR